LFQLLRRYSMFEGLFRPMHLLLILFIVLIIFGPGRLPEIGEGLGKSIRSFKKAMTEKDDLKEEPKSIEQKEEKKA
ncbi:MAG TPA: twin-arginine translocase TatA/TatE family subunit, partial [Nitrospirota bacterium]|nr:twin-arginine translocase TatA/TatE family subunit [Nitrospirota bacterium]